MPPHEFVYHLITSPVPPPPPESVSVLLCPLHIDDGAAIAEVGSALLLLMVKLAPLSEPVVNGTSLMTLILYPVPYGVGKGIVTDICWAPDSLETTLCKFKGVAKEPEASDN